MNDFDRGQPNEGSTMNYVAGYIAALVTFVAADMVWLGTMAPRFYKPMLGDIAIPGVNLAPAIVFYTIYPIGLLIFAINPAMKSGALADAALYGALFGFFTYATYDLSNYTTLRNWPLQLTLVDVAWGTILGAATSAVSSWIVGKMLGAA
jgi:uncharacterized membrane protein